MAKNTSHRLWSVPRITHPSHPGFTVRITELVPGGALYVCRWLDGKQRMKQLEPRTTRKDLGSTPAQQEKAARARGAQIIERLAFDEPEDDPTVEGLTIGRLLHAYEAEAFVTTQPSYRRAQVGKVRSFAKVVGYERLVSSINKSDVERWILERRKAGDSQNTIRSYYEALAIAVRWALGHHLPDGTPLLAANPLAGLRKGKLLPSDPNVNRPVATGDRYERLRAVADRLPAMFGVLLDVLWATGRRRSAVLGLKWEDIEFGKSDDTPYGEITWYSGSTTSNKRQQSTIPMNQLAREALARWRKQSPAIGKSWVFSGVTSPGLPLNPHTASHWLKEAEKLAGLEHVRGGGWHMLRRAWATQRKGMPLADVMAAGGWRDEHVLLRSYQHADPKTVLAVVNNN